MEPSLQETHDLMQAVLGEVEQVVMGKRPVLDLCAVGILAGGNTLFEDNPGLAKTLLSNTFAQALGINFKRVQFTTGVLEEEYFSRSGWIMIFKVRTNTVSVGCNNFG